MDFQLLCCFCEARFKNIEELESHLKSPPHRISSKSKYFPCRTNNCGEEFQKFQSFKKHVINVHNISASNNAENVAKGTEGWTPSNITFDSIVVNSIANLRMNGSVTGTALGNFLDETENILSDYMSSVQKKKL